MSNSSDLPRAVVDTNQVVSGVIIGRGSPEALLRAWYRGEFRWLITRDILTEYADVLRRPKLLTAFDARPADVDAFLRLIVADAEPVVPLTALPVSVRDPQDEKLLAAALGGQADNLVTGDKDLLALAGDPHLGALRIVTVADFLFLLTL